jgi:methyl-accepting chemotaxis protein
MTLHQSIDATKHMDRLARAAAAFGYEIIDIADLLDLVEGRAKEERSALDALGNASGELSAANGDLQSLAQDMRESALESLREVQNSVALVRQAGDRSRGVASWVQNLHARATNVRTTLKAVDANNAQIAHIAAQVNTLAINAKIEAARAGEAGRGFAVVADAINDLSQKTSKAATNITENIAQLTSWLGAIGREAAEVAENAGNVIGQSEETNDALTRMEAAMQEKLSQAEEISAQSQRTDAAMAALTPAVSELDRIITDTCVGIEDTQARVHKLINVSEAIVQSANVIGGASVDAPFIEYVRNLAKSISAGLELAVAEKRITIPDLLDRDYTPVQGSNPAQFNTRATGFLENFLPSYLEPALGFDDKVRFCVALDVNGYAPVHKEAVSHSQGAEVVRNAASSHDRRICDDRVGLKAGNNKAPFLLQVYRRDMGGGAFRMMKDLSAPIRVDGQHWGAIRLGYSY